MNKCCQRLQANVTRARVEFEFQARKASQKPTIERHEQLEAARHQLQIAQHLADEHTAEHYTEEAKSA